jgi:hypothetical protein
MKLKSHRIATQTRLFWLFIFLTILWMMLMRPYTPGNIIGFELAKTTKAVEHILSDWGQAGMQQAQTSIYLDFVFILLYCTSIMLGCLVSATYADHEMLTRFSPYFAIAIWIAGFFDAMENVAMLKTLENVKQATISVAYYLASAKFMIVAFALLFILIATLQGIIIRSRAQA